jgi:hypothetical protein
VVVLRKVLKKSKSKVGTSTTFLRGASCCFRGQINFSTPALGVVLVSDDSQSSRSGRGSAAFLV